MTIGHEHDFFFLTALPRTGSSLLRSMLNENPDLWATPSTATPEVLGRLQQDTMNYESVLLNADLPPLHMALVRHGLHAMYADRPEMHIIDQSRLWGTPYFYNMLCAILGSSPRIITIVRPLPEIVASVIRKADENPDTNFLDRQMRERDFSPYHRKPINDARVDYLLSDNSLQGAMLSLAGAYREETADSFHVIRYADLVADPVKTVDSIYDFLGLARYPHTFSSIRASNVELDAAVLGIPDMHTVRPDLAITAEDPATVLSDYGMSRCLAEDFWTERLGG